MLLVRHAWAGERSEWAGDDRDRPLDERGLEQSLALVHALAPYDIGAILSSPYRRCISTVAPLARVRGIEVELREELGEERIDPDGWALVRAQAGLDHVLCGHGGLERALPSRPAWTKGAVLVVDASLNVEDVLGNGG